MWHAQPHPEVPEAVGMRHTRDYDVPPIHPGEILMEEYLAPLGVTQHRLSVAIAGNNSNPTAASESTVGSTFAPRSAGLTLPKMWPCA